MSSRTWMGWACLLAFCYCHKIPFKVKSAIHIALHCHVWGDTTYKAAKSNMEPEKAKLSRIPCLARERESIGENRESFEPCLGFCITLCSYGCCHTSKWLITRSQWQAAATPYSNAWDGTHTKKLAHQNRFGKNTGQDKQFNESPQEKGK